MDAYWEILAFKFMGEAGVFEVAPAALISRLLADNRAEDLKLAAEDEEARKRFYREYGMID